MPGCVTPASVRAEKYFTRTPDPDACWIWRGYRAEGYGKIAPVKTDGKAPLLAHRVLYEAEVGPIPEGMQLDHFYCDNGAGGCVRPSHCRPVSHRENALRGNTLSSIALAKTHCVHGHEYTPANTVIDQGKRRCRVCRNAQTRRYHECLGREKRNAIFRAWKAKNREHVRRYHAAWYKRNRERLTGVTQLLTP